MWTHALPTTKCSGRYCARARPCRGPWRTTSGLSPARLPHCQHKLATAVRAHRGGRARRARNSGLPIGYRHAQPERWAHMRGPACAPARAPSVRRSTCRRNRRALRVEQRSLRRWVRKARVRPFRRAINHAGAWTGWRSRRREACGHTCAECAQGRRSWVQVRQTHPHPVALTPVGSFIAVESVVDDLGTSYYNNLKLL